MGSAVGAVAEIQGRPSEELVLPAGVADRRSYELAKRLLDVAIATLGLLLAAPVLLLLAIAIKATSPGPVFFRHIRCGRYGRPFGCWKLRTMVASADGTLLLTPSLNEEFTRSFKLPVDPRVTSVGRFLRRTSLDELPQLWNVVRGEMSLVGPRPVREEELRLMYGAAAAAYLSVRPGLTGLWQISGRSTCLYEERVRLDTEYVRTRSMTVDLWILLRTPQAVVSMRGAF